MLKNSKGVTLVDLVITIVVILILGASTITTSDMLIRDTKKKTIITNMYLVKSEVEAIYDEYQFSGDSAVLEGQSIANLLAYGITVHEGDLWYMWGETVLSNLGLDPDMLSSGGKYIVNYTTGEILYTKGFREIDGTVKYTLTDLLKQE